MLVDDDGWYGMDVLGMYFGFGCFDFFGIVLVGK